MKNSTLAALSRLKFSISTLSKLFRNGSTEKELMHLVIEGLTLRLDYIIEEETSSREEEKERPEQPSPIPSEKYDPNDPIPVRIAKTYGLKLLIETKPGSRIAQIENLYARDEGWKFYGGFIGFGHTERDALENLGIKLKATMTKGDKLVIITEIPEDVTT